MSAPNDRRDRGANALDHALAPVLPVLLAVLGVACFAGFVRAAAIAPLHVSLDPNEGWNAYHALAAIAGHGLYPDPASFMTNNYPPLSFYVTGFFGALIGDNIVAGRVLSLASFLCVCGFAAVAVRRMNGSWRAADFAAFLLAGTLLLTSDYVGMDDPQLLGHAIQLAGLLIVLREPRTRPAMFLSAGLFVAGGFVKHNLFALPLACLVWLVLFDRRNGLRFALWLIVFSLSGLLAFRVVFGFDLLERLNSPRAWSVAQLEENLLSWLATAAISLCALGALVLWSRNDKAVVLTAIYAALALVSGTLLLGGAGVDVNAMFDADIALALGVGLALGRLAGRRSPLPHIAGRALALACVAPLAVIAVADHDSRHWSFWTHPMRDEAALAEHDLSFLRTHSGPAMCESLAFCYWAGKPAGIDVFNLDQQLIKHARDPAPFLRQLDSHHFSAIELDETTPFPLPPDLQVSMNRNYRVDHSDDEGVFFVPK